MFELVTTGPDEPHWSLEIGARAITVGRDASNTLVFAEPSVSAHHAVVWLDGTEPWVRDIGSSNGTFVNGVRIRGAQALREGDHVRFGAAATVWLRAATGCAEPPAYMIRDRGSSAWFPVVGDRFQIGSARTADLRIDGAPETSATLLVYKNGEVWLGVEEQDRPLSVGEVFEVAGRQLELALAPAGRSATTAQAGGAYRYRIVATLAGPTGPEAEVLELDGAAHLRVTGGNRAILLYLLGRKFDEDRRQRAGNEVGWCPDDEVMTGLWGRHGDENKLHVLLHRLRADLRNAGFDPWFIEKRHRFVRARVSDVELR